MLKTSVLILYFFLFHFSGFSQNLVPNASFETHSRCPDFLGSVKSYNFNSPGGLVDAWYANPPSCTPDYFHRCGKNKFRVPKNLCGEMLPKEGDGYIGMILRIGMVYYGSPGDILYREHVTAKLKTTLQKDYRYRVRFHVSLSAYSNYAISNIGALFTPEPIVIKENKHFAPQVCYQGSVVRRKGAWVVIEDTLLARGGEQYITLGNFDTYAQRKIRKIPLDKKYMKKFNYNRAYYYLDDVLVESLGPAPKVLPPDIPDDEQTLLVTEEDTIRVGEKIILNNIFFAFDKADLLPMSFPELNKLVRLLKDMPDLHILMMGHTDSIGTQEKNQVLSENRAKSVVNYLIAQGISEHRLRYLGFGETQPVAANDDAAGRQKNRRVEFVISRPIREE